MFKKIKEWFNGKKTVIGSVMLIVAGILDESGTTSKILYALGTLFAGTGIAHKKKKGEI
ncbi:MAG: hypothetical protein SCALA702_25720 [Melioribacteraceae bacterium]|nr:MAG: hypothetical protein SCALA702_25720 [Melioribacteraceae bacterium]